MALHAKMRMINGSLGEIIFRTCGPYAECRRDLCAEIFPMGNSECHYSCCEEDLCNGESGFHVSFTFLFIILLTTFAVTFFVMRKSTYKKLNFGKRTDNTLHHL